MDWWLLHIWFVSGLSTCNTWANNVQSINWTISLSNRRQRFQISSISMNHRQWWCFIMFWPSIIELWWVPRTITTTIIKREKKNNKYRRSPVNIFLVMTANIFEYFHRFLLLLFLYVPNLWVLSCFFLGCVKMRKETVIIFLLVWTLDWEKKIHRVEIGLVASTVLNNTAGLMRWVFNTET